MVSPGLDLTSRECNLIFPGLFELTITYVEDDDLRAECKALAARLGGDPEAMFFAPEHH